MGRLLFIMNGLPMIIHPVCMERITKTSSTISERWAEAPRRLSRAHHILQTWVNQTPSSCLSRVIVLNFPRKFLHMQLIQQGLGVEQIDRLGPPCINMEIIALARGG